jgi:hypothetical protein
MLKSKGGAYRDSHIRPAKRPPVLEVRQTDAGNLYLMASAAADGVLYRVPRLRGRGLAVIG